MMLAVVFLLTAGSVSAHRQEATPAVAESSGAMEQTLALVPAQIPGLEDSTSLMISYADIAGQLDAVGVSPPESMGAEGFDRWAAATRGLPLPSHAAQYLNTWRDDYGFDLLQDDQTLWMSLPPFDLTIFRGQFDTAEVRQALESIGYQAVEVGGHELLSIRGDFEQDLQAATAYRMAAMNFGVILDDGTLAFASAGEPLAAVLDVAAGAPPQ